MRKMKDSGIEWIGEIPESWDALKCKYILSDNDGGLWGDDPKGNEHDKTVIRSTEQTIDGKWCIESPAKRDLGEVDYSKGLIKKYDLLITKSSGSNLHIGKTTIADDYFEINECYFSNFIQRIRCVGFFPQLLWYLFNSTIVREQFVYLQNTTSGLGNINADIINNLKIPLPPIEEQTVIATYLDRQCAHFDNIIEKTKASIEEYKKLRQAVITRAVTKGVRGDRPMRDSGIEWIGEIPEEWKVVFAFQCFTPVKNKNVGMTENNLLSLSYGKIKRKSIDAVEGLLPESFETYNIIDSDDIVLRLTDLQNDHKSLRVGLSTERGIITSAYVTIRNKSDSLPKYLYYYLHSFDISKGFYGMGAGVRQGLNWDELKHLKLCSPSVEEQKEITAHLDNKCAEIDTLITKKEQFLTELESYKKSMIYEYVTGKKEVPHA